MNAELMEKYNSLLCKLKILEAEIHLAKFFKVFRKESSTRIVEKGNSLASKDWENLLQNLIKKGSYLPNKKTSFEVVDVGTYRFKGHSFSRFKPVPRGYYTDYCVKYISEAEYEECKMLEIEYSQLESEFKEIASVLLK